MAENLKQVGLWAEKVFHREEKNIRLYMKLTRKDVTELLRFPVPDAFDPIFRAVCKEFDTLEEEIKDGINDHLSWAKRAKVCADQIFQNATLL